MCVVMAAMPDPAVVVVWGEMWSREVAGGKWGWKTAGSGVRVS